jgi:hypothetical protein
MKLVLRELILWPRAAKAPRRVKFAAGKVNVISGASKTGKSAVIPIIDYCMGSDRCGIPVGVIRTACEWFGVLIDTAEGQKLLARREPEGQRQTEYMFISEGPEVQVPERIERHNTVAPAVKQMLNRLAGLPNIGFAPESTSGFKARPSFRDLAAFLFQPQNVVANPDVLFFKADTAEHRERLKTIFPLVLGAINGLMLTARMEHDVLARELRRKERELRAVQDVSARFQSQARGWLQQAVELGLLPPDVTIPQTWPQTMDLLRSLAGRDASRAVSTGASIDATMRALADLRGEESVLAGGLLDARERLRHLEGLRESAKSFGAAIEVQRDRLALSEWLRSLPPPAREGPLVGPQLSPSEDLERLCTALGRVEDAMRVQPQSAEAIEQELIRVRGEVRETAERAAALRDRIRSLSEGAARTGSPYSESAIDQFIGRLQQALVTFDESATDGELADEVAALREKVAELARLFSEAGIKAKTKRALDRIQHIAGIILTKLDAEWPDRAIRFSVQDLSIQVVGEKRDDWLWEIGSGANWLSYHVAVSAAIQRFFMESERHPVPHLLIYDQPSQVYFPRRLAGDNSEPQWKDEDVVAVRKVFSTLSDEVDVAKGRLQVLVLDHADASVWHGLKHIHLVEEWRGRPKLVPMDWLS